MELHTCLWNDVAAFDFTIEDLKPVQTALPDVTLIRHPNADSFLAAARKVRLLLTWEFPVDWYEKCPDLEVILTPAAGSDWVASDPEGSVSIIHGSFHGPILAESLLSALLYMNHRMPEMIVNFQNRAWDRNIQRSSKLLSQQTVLIIGLGSIGRSCAQLIQSTGARVIGVRRQVDDSPGNIETYGINELPRLLAEADHVALLLPGTPETDRFMNIERLSACKPGAIIYNFGRGNALYSEDLIDCWSRLGGAFLDVTQEEPLPESSPLWQLDNIMITPHSSCIYDDYRRIFLEEAVINLQQHLN